MSNTTHQDMLAQSLHDLCKLAQGVSGAVEPVLRLARGQTQLSAPLARAGLQLKSWQARAAIPERSFGAPVLHEPAEASRFATDLVELVLDIPGEDGRALLVVHLPGVAPAALSPHDRETLLLLAQVMQRQISLLFRGPALVAQPALRLVSLLREFDGDAVSHALSALLAVLAGESPSAVELTALRIVGLADMPQAGMGARDIILSEAAQELLTAAGLELPVSTVEASALASRPQPAIMPNCELAPFANVCIADSRYEVAESDDRLWFRLVAGQQGWMRLANQLDDGWTVIAAEMLATTLNIFDAFAQMHAIHHRDESVAGGPEVYELCGLVWSIHRDAENKVMGRLAEGPWQPCALDPALPVRQLALAALPMLVPDLKSRLMPEADAWAARMAHAVQVVPVLAAA